MDKTEIKYSVLNTPQSPTFASIEVGSYFTDPLSDNREIYLKMAPLRATSGRAVDILDGLEGSFDSTHRVNVVKSIDIKISF